MLIVNPSGNSEFGYKTFHVNDSSMIGHRILQVSIMIYPRKSKLSECHPIPIFSI